jgi:hypothetical protein
MITNHGLIIPPTPGERSFDVLRRENDISVWVGTVRARDLTTANTKAYQIFGSRCYARERTPTAA